MSDFHSYDPISLSEIPQGKLGFDLFLPLGEPGERKMVRVHSIGSTLSPERIAQYSVKGIRFLHFERKERAKLWAYAGSIRGHASSVAQGLLESLLSDDGFGAEEEIHRHTSGVLARWIDRPGFTPPRVWSELQIIGETQAFSSHASRVSSYAVIFAMAFGHEDPAMLTDLSLAGRLHDLGRVSLGFQAASTASQLFESEERSALHSHPQASVGLIEKFAPEIPERVKKWILQHHERFGGGGYPAGLDGYAVDDLAQILGAADMLDELASGLWDGKRRGLVGAFEEMEGFDRVQSFPKYFNPDLFKTLLNWARAKRKPKPDPLRLAG